MARDLIVTKEDVQLVITEESGKEVVVFPASAPSIVFSAEGPQGAVGPGVPGNNDVGVIYLKNNATPTPISEINARAVVAGSMQAGELLNFVKDATTNSLKYNGPGGKFHVVATFNFATSNQNICGFYIGCNTNETAPLDANADRISESEIYVNSSTSANQPVGSAIQTVLELQPGHRIFFIVQNRTSANAITVEFLKFTATALTAEKGDQGDQGPSGASVPRSITIVDPVANDAFTLFYTKVSTTISSVRALVRGGSPSVTFILKADPDRDAVGTAITASKTVTSTTTGEEATIINQPVPSGYYVWMEITAVSGTVNEFNVGIEV
jgi:hypothetical protein